eukprot:GHVU01123376.1.p1 GENE.GHVU01123376.1~~GHVU01123376.1.p1  ORF type:complete len:156 (-),score=12.16 GHVU01123376.1:1444-1911(-)
MTYCQSHKCIWLAAIVASTEDAVRSADAPLPSGTVSVHPCLVSCSSASCMCPLPPVCVPAPAANAAMLLLVDCGYIPSAPLYRQGDVSAAKQILEDFKRRSVNSPYRADDVAHQIAQVDSLLGQCQRNTTQVRGWDWMGRERREEGGEGGKTEGR